MYDWVTLLYSRNWHNIVNQPYFNQKITIKNSDINHANVFLGQSPKAIEIKAKTNKWDLIKCTRFAQQRKP